MNTYGLIGKKLSHSFSKRYFTQKFQQLGIDARYELFELNKIDDFPALLQAHPSLRGLNVTIPFKTQVIPFLDQLSPEARAVGAVNTIAFEKGIRVGHNTDIIGFESDVKKLIGKEPITRALVLGSGGAARAVTFVLQNKLGITPLLVSRKPEAGQVGYEALQKLDWDSFRLLINTSPLGMYPHIEAAPAIPYPCLSASHFAYDLIYNPQETRFMQLCKARGAQVRNGMGMLIGQAEAAWKIWNA